MGDTPHSSGGDSQGRRVSRNKAALLAEAGRISHTLQRLLIRAGYDGKDLDDLIRRITREEQQALLQAHGRIEPRSRFKVKSSHPLLDGRKADLLFLDESGKSVGGNEPVFALGAVAMTKRAHREYVRMADEIKLEFCGTTQVTFHEPQMRRHETIFNLGADPVRQREFCTALDRLIEQTRFTVFGVAIRKDLLAQLVESGGDPYLPWDTYGVAIHLLLERYVDYLAHGETPKLGRATFESQGPKEDALHHLEYTSLLLSGTQWVPATSFRNWLETSARFVPKGGSHGTELADMFSRDLYEWVRDGCEREPRRWSVFNEKVYKRDDMMMGKFGVKVFPDSDIRARIDTHRARCAGQVG